MFVELLIEAEQDVGAAPFEFGGVAVALELAATRQRLAPQAVVAHSRLLVTDGHAPARRLPATRLVQVAIQAGRREQRAGVHPAAAGSGLAQAIGDRRGDHPRLFDQRGCGAGMDFPAQRVIGGGDFAGANVHLAAGVAQRAVNLQQARIDLGEAAEFVAVAAEDEGAGAVLDQGAVAAKLAPSMSGWKSCSRYSCCCR